MQKTSSRVILISPMGIWKVFVSPCHRSTNAETTILFEDLYVSSIKGLKPDAVMSAANLVQSALVYQGQSLILDPCERHFIGPLSLPYQMCAATCDVKLGKRDGSEGPPGNAVVRGRSKSICGAAVAADDPGADTGGGPAVRSLSEVEASDGGDGDRGGGGAEGPT